MQRCNGGEEKRHILAYHEGIRSTKPLAIAQLLCQGLSAKRLGNQAPTDVRVTEGLDKTDSVGGRTQDMQPLQLSGCQVILFGHEFLLRGGGGAIETAMTIMRGLHHFEGEGGTITTDKGIEAYTRAPFISERKLAKHMSDPHPLPL